MPEPTKKELMYSSLDELKEKAKFPELGSLKNSKNVDRLKSAINRCHIEGEQSLKEGDAERAYIFFTRAVDAYVLFKKYKCLKDKDDKYDKCMFGPAIAASVKHLEKLDEDLRKKYELKKQMNKLSLANEPEKLNGEQDSNCIDNRANRLSSNNLPYSNGVPYPSAEENRSSISSIELFNLIDSTNPCSTLILDIRQKEEFEKSSMMIKDVINIPQNLIVPGVIASKLETSLEERFRPFFRKRGEYDLVIVVDWSSRSDENFMRPPMKTMLKSLNVYDINAKRKSKAVILEGGYEDWLSRYPNLTNGMISPPKESFNNKFSLEEISYPMNALFEPEKKEKPLAPAIPATIPKPSIDRSTKPATFFEKKIEDTEEPKENCIAEPIPKIQSQQPTISVHENNVTKIIVKNEISDPKPPSNLNGRRESLESDEELKKQYCRSGRRAALTENEVQSPLLNQKKDDESGELSNYRKNDGDEPFMGKKAVNNIYNETGMKMKRYSSTPNISELGMDESSRPPIDRSTKPSNDDQLNYYTTGYIYNESGKGLTGLRNIGNTCYMNSILQCLSNTDPLRRKFCSWDMRMINEKSKTRGAVAREVISIMKQLWNSDGGSISCKSLKNIIGQYNEMFSGHDQQDSHEFLTILMDWLHEDLNEPPTRQNLDGADENSGEKAWGEFISKNNSIIRKLFYGQLRSTVSCNVCQKKSVTFEPFSNLSLSLPSEEIDKCTLSECLKLYISSDDVDKWQCPGCKQLRRATKKLDITKLPPLLVIHFKRFTSVGGCKKQRTYVDFPDALNMKPYIAGDEHRHQQYQLYAVSNHSGSMESGHYTAYCKNPTDRRWYEFDDQNVYPMNSIPKSREAYIVFYQTMKN